MVPDATAIEKVLKEKVAPFLQSHNGGIKLKSVSLEGEIRIAFMGACTNCPLLGDTLAQTVETSLQEAFPEAKLKIIVVNDIDDDLWAMAKNMLRKK